MAENDIMFVKHGVRYWAHSKLSINDRERRTHILVPCKTVKGLSFCSCEFLSLESRDALSLYPHLASPASSPLHTPPHSKGPQQQHSRVCQPCGHLPSPSGIPPGALNMSPICRNSPQEKGASLGNPFPFSGPGGERGFRPMKTHRVNKWGHTPQRAPRTPRVRSQALHLCANGVGLGIRDYRSPELHAAARSLCPEGSGRFLGLPLPSPPLPSPVL